MKIEFTKDTPVNKGVFKKGEKANFTEDIANIFISNGEAKEFKEVQKPTKEK